MKKPSPAGAVRSGRALKKAQREGWYLGLADESAASLQPLVRSTWAKKGQTPIVRHWQLHDKQTLFSLLVLSPQRRRLQLLWHIQRPAYRTWNLVFLVRRLQKQLGGKLLLVWDRLPAHRAAAKHLRSNKIKIVFLPPYAPELNPVEWVWSQAKYARLANGVPDDTDEVEERYHDTLAEFNQEQKLLRGFFHGAGLSLE